MGKLKLFYLDIDTYQNTEDAFALMNIVKLAERDIENGRVRKASDVFNGKLFTRSMKESLMY